MRLLRTVHHARRVLSHAVVLRLCLCARCLACSWCLWGASTLRIVVCTTVKHRGLLWLCALPLRLLVRLGVQQRLDKRSRSVNSGL